MQSFGLIDPRSLRAADTSAKTYQLHGMEKSTLGVYEKVLKAMQVSVAMAEASFLTAVFNYIHALETCGESARAEEELQRLADNIPSLGFPCEKPGSLHPHRCRVGKASA